MGQLGFYFSAVFKKKIRQEGVTKYLLYNDMSIFDVVTREIQHLIIFPHNGPILFPSFIHILSLLLTYKFQCGRCSHRELITIVSLPFMFCSIYHK